MQARFLHYVIPFESTIEMTVSYLGDLHYLMTWKWFRFYDVAGTGSVRERFEDSNSVVVVCLVPSPYWC